MSSDWRFVEHTGDFAAELEADSLSDLYAVSVQAFTALLLEDGAKVEARDPVDIALEGMDAEDLLVALGNELLFLFETEGFLSATLELDEAGETTVRGRVIGEALDPKRHVIARPIKAVTHHGIVVTRGERLNARIVYDL